MLVLRVAHLAVGHMSTESHPHWVMNVFIRPSHSYPWITISIMAHGKYGMIWEYQYFGLILSQPMGRSQLVSSYTVGVLCVLHPTVPHPSWYGVDEIWASSIPFGRHRNTILIVVRCRVSVSHSSPTTRLRGRYATRWVFKIDALV